MRQNVIIKKNNNKIKSQLDKPKTSLTQHLKRYIDVYIYVCTRIYSVYSLHLSVSKYILLYNHHDNSEHSDRSASVVYQLLHTLHVSACACVSLWAPPVLQSARLAVSVET